MLLVPNSIPFTVGSVSAPVTAMSTSPPRTRAEKPPNVTSTVARSSGLATSRLASLCAWRSAAPDRLTPRWESPGRPRSWRTANGPVRRISRLISGCATATSLSPGPELTPHALRQQRRTGLLDIPQDRVGVSDELPAPGRLTWVYRAEFAGKRDGTGRHRGPWLRPARHPQSRVAVDQIGETGREPAAPAPPHGGGVGVDHLGGRQPGVGGDLGEVRAVVDDVDHHVGAAIRGGLGSGGDPQLVQPAAGDSLESGIVELDQHRAGGGDDVDHAGQRGIAQCVHPRQYLGGAAALQHQRLVAVVENRVAGP